jgi:hypothetical protein
LSIFWDWILPDSIFLGVAIMDWYTDIPPNSPQNFCLFSTEVPTSPSSRWCFVGEPAHLVSAKAGLSADGIQNLKTAVGFQNKLPFLLDSHGLTWIDSRPSHCPEVDVFFHGESVVGLVYASRLVRFACGSLLLLIFMLVLVTPVSVSSELNTIIPDGGRWRAFSTVKSKSCLRLARWSLVVSCWMGIITIYLEAERSYLKKWIGKVFPFSSIFIISPEDFHTFLRNRDFDWSSIGFDMIWSFWPPIKRGGLHTRKIDRTHVQLRGRGHRRNYGVVLMWSETRPWFTVAAIQPGWLMITSSLKKGVEKPSKNGDTNFF